MVQKIAKDISQKRKLAVKKDIERSDDSILLTQYLSKNNSMKAKELNETITIFQHPVNAFSFIKEGHSEKVIKYLVLPVVEIVVKDSFLPGKFKTNLYKKIYEVKNFCSRKELEHFQSLNSNLNNSNNNIIRLVA
jgi:hypothetical protein